MDMDPVSSSSSTTTLRPNSPHQRFKPTQPVVERIVRALCHPLFLLHRSESDFFVLGATGNVYKVTLSSTPSPCRLSRLLGTPTSPEALAGASLRERFHQLFSEGKKHGGRSEGVKEIDEGTVCPICLEEMEKKDKVAACSTCQNPIHEECLTRRKSSRERRSANCVICRARWRSDQGKYLNLAAYIGRDDAEGGGGSGLCAE
ncbi:hypothetical protein V6N11_062647 [Hibiscus sabdariffa]|uniref:RING-type domain-containing protein n=1 Tax=Hibiscus sabdariffa TaxID=183260 RepID=A0ABR2PT56_9ROSI